MAVYLVWFKTVMISWSSPLIHASLTILPTILAVPITKKNGHLTTLTFVDLKVFDKHLEHIGI